MTRIEIVTQLAAAYYTSNSESVHNDVNLFVQSCGQVADAILSDDRKSKREWFNKSLSEKDAILRGDQIL